MTVTLSDDRGGKSPIRLLDDHVARQRIRAAAFDARRSVGYTYRPGDRAFRMFAHDDLSARADCGGLTVDICRVDSAVELVLIGELDLKSVQVVREALDAIAHDPPERLVIDLHGLSFMDSTGIHLLVTENNRVRRRGGEVQLEIRPGSPAVQRVLEVVGLEKELPFCDG
jgi:anti-anti-sigma factor